MKRKIAVLLALVLAFSVFTTMAFAAVPAAPTGDGNYFFANGVAVTIEDTVDTTGKTLTVPAGFTATGTDAYIVWGDNYVGVTKDAWVFGGCDARAATDADKCELASASITMNGGEVYYIFGGSLGVDGTYNGTTDTVLDTAYGKVGSATVNLKGGKLGYGLMAGRRNTAVGTFTVNINASDNIDLEDALIAAGICGNGTEGYKDPFTAPPSVVTNATVGAAVINVNGEGGNPYIGTLMAGGSGLTSVGSVTINAVGPDIREYCGSGYNGYVGSVTANFADTWITGKASAVLRGLVGDTTTSFTNGSWVANLETGVANGAYSSDSGADDLSGVTGDNTWNIDSTSGVEKALLTPSAVEKEAGALSGVMLGNLTVNNENEDCPIPMEMGEFTTTDESETVSQIYGYGDIDLGGVDLAIKDVDFVTDGDTTIGEDSSVSLENSFLGNAGNIKNNGKFAIDEDSTVFNVDGGVIDNNGEMENKGDLANVSNGDPENEQPPVINNSGTITNSGAMGGDMGAINNNGTINNSGQLVNNGCDINNGPKGEVEGNFEQYGVRLVTNVYVGEAETKTWTGKGFMVLIERSEFEEFLSEALPASLAQDGANPNQPDNGYYYGDDQGWVEFDGNKLTPADFTAERGSVLITLEESFLKTVSNGKHIVSICFPDGSYAETEITVNVATPEPAGRPNPSTGIGFIDWLMSLFA